MIYVGFCRVSRLCVCVLEVVRWALAVLALNLIANQRNDTFPTALTQHTHSTRALGGHTHTQSHEAHFECIFRRFRAVNYTTLIYAAIAHNVHDDDDRAYANNLSHIMVVVAESAFAFQELHSFTTRRSVNGVVQCTGIDIYIFVVWSLDARRRVHAPLLYPFACAVRWSARVCLCLCSVLSATRQTLNTSLEFFVLGARTRPSHMGGCVCACIYDRLQFIYLLIHAPIQRRASLGPTAAVAECDGDVCVERGALCASSIEDTRRQIDGDRPTVVSRVWGFGPIAVRYLHRREQIDINYSRLLNYS